MKNRRDRYNDRYVLVDGEPVVEPDLITWAVWFETADRRVRETFLNGVHIARVSTVFLGLNHSFDDGPPVLWETMIFGGPLDGYLDRYRSRVEAIAGHSHAIMLARDADA